jgi:hypothetical protein
LPYIRFYQEPCFQSELISVAGKAPFHSRPAENGIKINANEEKINKTTKNEDKYSRLGI